MIASREELIKRLEDLRAVEIGARKGYIEDMGNFTDKEIVEIVGKIKKDEDKHIGLLDELIKMLQKP
jgi:rubrerythrin